MSKFLDFLSIFIIVFIECLVFSVIMILVNDFVISVIVFLLYSIFHFIYSSWICNNYEFKKSLFSVYYFLCWVLILGLFFIFLNTDFFYLLPGTSGMFGGIRYVYMLILMVLYLIILYLLKLIVFIISNFKKTKKM